MTLAFPSRRNALRIVLPGGASRGAPWIASAIPDADLREVRDGDQKELQAQLRDADAIVCAHLTPSDTALATNLRLVHVLGAGWDGIAAEALPPGCVLCNVFEHETAIGEWVIMSMLALTRRLLQYDNALRRGEWQQAVFFSGIPESDLRGHTVGTIGLGHVGARVAELARAIGMRAIAVTRFPSGERQTRHGLEWLGGLEQLTTLFTKADFAVVCVPLSPATRGLIGDTELRALGPNGYLLNIARGPIVDESALYAALRDGAIAGAALDVWYRYPPHEGMTTMPANLPFWELDNVIMTPHSSGWSSTTLTRRWEFIAGQLARLARGEPLQNVIQDP